MLLSIASCKKEDSKNPVDNDPVQPEEPVQPGGTTGHGSYRNSSSEMAVTIPDIYIGAVYEGASINDLTFKAIEKTLDPIEISYTFPRYYFDSIENPSYSSMVESMNAAISSPYFSGKQLESFYADNCRQFSNYSELKLAFGADVDIAKIFNLDESANSDKIKAKTGLCAGIVQKNFSIIMDYPYEGNVFANDDDLNAVASTNPVYVNSITYGHMAIVAIESESSFKSLEAAFRAAITADKVGGELNISPENKEILKNSTIRIYICDDAKTFTGFDKFHDFIASLGKFTAENPGRPIFFTANRVEDNSGFWTSF